jgi:luciferase family oxidoreductase group 1
MSPHLSILDFDQPGHAVELAGAAERLGYRRFWLGEHHSEEQCNNPLLLGALLAAATTELRLGSGGVCLFYQSPTRIAEDARLIEFLVPDRFDLGVTRGLNNQLPWQQAALLDGRAGPTSASFESRLRELHGLVTRRFPAGHPLAGLPGLLGQGPPLWVLGLSPGTARLAGQLGSGFCYSLHHAAQRTDGPEVVDAYRRGFIPSPEFPEPAVLLVVSGICASTEAAARAGFDRTIAKLPPRDLEKVGYRNFIIGSPELWGERLPELAAAYGVDEVLILDLLTGELPERLEMCSLLARCFGLSPRAGREGLDAGELEGRIPGE